MVISYLILTLGAGLIDSLNPIAIAQQFVLQSSTKNKHSILAYILGIGITNFIFGILFYFGLAQIIGNLYQNIQDNYPWILTVFFVTAGVGLIVYSVRNYIIKQDVDMKKTDEVKNTAKSLTTWQLFTIGVVSCLAELSSALPYLAYLTVLITADIPWTFALTLLLIYNLVLFNLPLYILYAVSIYLDKYLVNIYRKFQRMMGFLIDRVLPVLGIILGLVLIYYGFSH